MAAEKTDRRVRRTRTTLIHALQDLILEKGYDAVTVQDILDRADVGRSTFYAHFRDKDDLLANGVELLHTEIDGAIALADHGRAPSVSEIALVVFQHAERNHRGFGAMMGGNSGEIVIRTARRYFEGHIRDEIAASPAGVPDPAIVDAVVDFQASALISLVTWWLDSGSTLSAEEMHRLYVTLTQPGVKAVLG